MVLLTHFPLSIIRSGSHLAETGLLFEWNTISQSNKAIRLTYELGDLLFRAVKKNSNSEPSKGCNFQTKFCSKEWFSKQWKRPRIILKFRPKYRLKSGLFDRQWNSFAWHKQQMGRETSSSIHSSLFGEQWPSLKQVTVTTDWLQQQHPQRVEIFPLAAAAAAAVLNAIRRHLWYRPPLR